MTKTCQKCQSPATLRVGDNSYEWRFCTDHTRDFIRNPKLAGYAMYVFPASGVNRSDLPADALALCR